MRELVRRFPHRDFVYLGDHGHAPYGDKSHEEIVQLTQEACDKLFRMGCGLVVLACNTATAVAARTLQQGWMREVWPDKKLLGIIAPTVEAATQTPWNIKEPVFPQKFNTDTIALFATTATVESKVYGEEIHKRCPKVTLVEQPCPRLVALLESGAPHEVLELAVEGYVNALLSGLNKPPEWAILGCTHYPLLQHIFYAKLPTQTRLLNQPEVLANALEDYLERHKIAYTNPGVRYLTTGNVAEVRRIAEQFLNELVPFEALETTTPPVRAA